MSEQFFKLWGYVVIRPIRYSFSRMVANTTLHIIPRKDEYFNSWDLPNIHWWVLYKTVFQFCKWLYWDAWRVFCDWSGGWRRTFPLHARIIQKIGQTTAGFAISGGECFHCASDLGCQVDLSQDETGEFFRLTDSGTDCTPNGTDHWFRGITTCPVCGFEDEYGDGSL